MTTVTAETLADLRQRDGLLRDELLAWIARTYRPGELFTIYRLADQLDGWQEGASGRECPTVSMSVWGLVREGKLWEFRDVEAKERGQRFKRYGLPLPLVPADASGTPPGWSGGR